VPNDGPARTHLSPTGRGNGAQNPEPLHIGYVATGFPFPSHVFIQNEVRALRGLGVRVATFTPQRSLPEHILSSADAEAARTTFAVKPFSLGLWSRAHLTALVRGHYVDGLRAAWRFRGPDWKSYVWQFMYFAQAVVLWYGARRAGVKHLHAHFANSGSDLAQIASEIGGSSWSWSFTMHGPTEFYDLRWYRLHHKVRTAAFVACISDFARSQLMAVSRPEDWPKLRIVHCGVDRTALPARSSDPDVRDVIRVVCVGRLVPEKGQHVLVDAVEELKRRGVPLRLTLVGDGPTRQQLEERVAREGLGESVLIAGAKPHPEVLAIVGDADVFCLPSFAEGVPVSLMEAMALGVPVVSTRVMGIPELIDDGATGILVAPGNADQLVGALERLAGDADLREQLGQAGRERIAADFDLWREAERLRDIFGEVVGHLAAERATADTLTA
jgi:colanic acid/amylovoran biosynthesis glycosyltransferase